ncbi:uncharacterized protein LOC34621387 [Cyclospora cayetanensis]|uniref:Uncharacterized protein LOC34621387 n=1 Tax=Cyclospora cayetanensis TaxID=88456 RepID=A0A6P6RTI7_9EIME|nr:uncharacterized protein LOC34621387 [Cyclospora cayetanensis]
MGGILRGQKGRSSRCSLAVALQTLLALSGAAFLVASASTTESQVYLKRQNEASAANAEGLPCTTGLRDAINAAILQAHSEHFVPNVLMQRYKTVPYVPLLACPPYTGPSGPSFWPELSDLHPSDLLLKVLNRQSLRVASYGPPPSKDEDKLGASRAARGYNWGHEGDYSKPQISGFLPDYLRHLAELISAKYKVPLRVEWVFYTTGTACLLSVINGETDMTDIYFLQSLPDEDTLPLKQALSSPTAAATSAAATHQTPPLMAEHFYRTCPVVASSASFVCKKDMQVETIGDIAVYIRGHPQSARVAYLTAANKRTLHFLLPPETDFVILTSKRAAGREGLATFHFVWRGDGLGAEQSWLG